MKKMTRDEIVNVMWDSWGRRVRYIDGDGNEWTGCVDNYESRIDNEDDELTGASITVFRDDGFNYIIYEDFIEFIEIIDLDKYDLQKFAVPV